MISEESGIKLLKFAKECVHSKLFNTDLVIDSEIKSFSEKQGVFVTIHKNSELRGCIGFVIGHFPLYQGIKNAAHAAGFEDPRFPPIEKSEWEELKFEISILTVPEKIEADPNNIEVGKDGLIVEYGGNAGLLLPQVATEWKWDGEEFLSQTCVKAGLSPNIWKKKNITLKKFQAQIFSE